MLKFTEFLPGIYKTVAGRGDPFSPLTLLQCTPRTDGLKELQNAPFPFSQEESYTEYIHDRTVIHLPLGKTEKLYGCGLQFHSVEQRGKTKYLRVNSDPKQDTGETHAPVPLYISSAGYGVLFDTSHIVTLYLGSTVRADSTNPPVCRNSTDDPEWKATVLSDCVEAAITGNGMQIYIFCGQSMMDAVRRYNLLCGGGKIPPVWALGFWYRAPSTSSQDDIIKTVQEFRSRHYPVDVIGLEPGWQSTNYPDSFVWHHKRFPDPETFGTQMHSLGVHLNNWEHAWVAPEAPFYREIRPYCGSHTVWGGLAPDYSLEKVRSIIRKQHLKDHIPYGVSGYKLDECDGSELTDCSWIFPAHASFPGGQDGEQMRQNYGLLMQKTIDSIFRTLGKRTFGLVRASGTGAPALPFVLYSDLYDHRQYIRALYNSSFTGLLWTPEVRRAASGEEWIRRIQTAVFSPLTMLNAWGDGTKPWTFPETAEIIQKFLRLRMRLIPYLYTAYAQYAYQGKPVIRSMELACGNITSQSAEKEYKEFNTVNAPYGRTKTFEFCDQYMIGDSLLVAPLFTGEKERKVFLPEGKWYGLESRKPYEGGCMKNIQCPLESIPVFVKDGTLLPIMDACDRMPDTPVDITVLAYGNTEKSRTELYEDDGTTYAYEQGVCRWIQLSIKNQKLKTKYKGKSQLWGNIFFKPDGTPLD
jgi:alpha-glucosidase (family GH31 glycosyl hydrolase)